MYHIVSHCDRCLNCAILCYITWKVLVVRRSEMVGPSLRQSLRRSFSLANNCLIQALLTLFQGWNETSALWIGVL